MSGFWSKSANVDAIERAVESGRTYYFQQHVQIGGFRARTKLEILDEASGVAALAKCAKHRTMTAHGLATARELALEHPDNTNENVDCRARKAEEKQAAQGKKAVEPWP